MIYDKIVELSNMVVQFNQEIRLGSVIPNITPKDLINAGGIYSNNCITFKSLPQVIIKCDFLNFELYLRRKNNG
jgi:hypothetical protein